MAYIHGLLGSTASQGGFVPLDASGGDSITTYGDWKLHRFTTSGTFTVNSLATGGTYQNNCISMFMVGGGGAGGDSWSAIVGGNVANSGAGAGAVKYNTTPDTGTAVTASAYTVTIGATQQTDSVNGNTTSIAGNIGGSVKTLYAGGGGGGSATTGANGHSTYGGSPGGGRHVAYLSLYTGSQGTAYEGSGHNWPTSSPTTTHAQHAGGNQHWNSGAGGGGGAGGTGTSSTSGSSGHGHGGEPIANTWWNGNTEYFAAGGGGGNNDGRGATTASKGGHATTVAKQIGGEGPPNDNYFLDDSGHALSNGDDGTGSGGGGCSMAECSPGAGRGTTPPGGVATGGSGVLIIRYKIVSY